jgi:hypothetical protein
MNKKDVLTKKYLINGPNNVIRLTDGNKVLYIFGDVHLEPQYQNECPYDEKYDSKDIDKLIFQFMKIEKKKQFDLFCEMENINLIPGEYFYRDNYINNFRKLFKSNIKKDNNEIKNNDKYPNFRFHFTDMRESLNNGFSIYYNDFDISPDNFSCLDKFDILIKNLNLFYEYITNINLKKENIYINKILKQYNDNNIKKKINDIFDKNIINLKKIIDDVKELFNFAKKNILSYSVYLFSTENRQKILYIDTLAGNYSKFLLVITDLYFIRRFLDKKYIKNGILYTGTMHLDNISYLLVKYFNYKITNIFVCDPKFKITDKIKKLEFNNYQHIDILLQHTINRQPNFDISQCVNLFDFPDNFS